MQSMFLSLQNWMTSLATAGVMSILFVFLPQCPPFLLRLFLETQKFQNQNETQSSAHLKRLVTSIKDQDRFYV